MGFNGFHSISVSFLQVELQIYLCGDFNLDPDCEDFLKHWFLDLGLQRLTSGPTNATRSRSLDHIFLWRERSMPLTCSGPIQPWVEGCPKGREELSDHCWQGVVSNF